MPFRELNFPQMCGSISFYTHDGATVDTNLKLYFLYIMVSAAVVLMIASMIVIMDIISAVKIKLLLGNYLAQLFVVIGQGCAKQCITLRTL